MAQNTLHFQKRHVDAGEALHFAHREIDDAILPEGVANNDLFRGRAAAYLHDQPGGHIEPRHHEGRIDAALETIARVRMDAELAAGVRDVGLVP